MFADVTVAFNFLRNENLLSITAYRPCSIYYSILLMYICCWSCQNVNTFSNRLVIKNRRKDISHPSHSRKQGNTSHVKSLGISVRKYGQINECWWSDRLQAELARHFCREASGTVRQYSTHSSTSVRRAVQDEGGCYMCVGGFLAGSVGWSAAHFLFISSVNGSAVDSIRRHLSGVNISPRVFAAAHPHAHTHIYHIINPSRRAQICVAA